MKELIGHLHSIGAIKFTPPDHAKHVGAPFQIDLSAVISHPVLGKKMAAAFWERIKPLTYDLLCGSSPLGGCIATFLAWKEERPLVVFRKESKEAIRRTIVGSYKTGQRCLLLHDHFSTGMSALDAVDHLEEEGLEVKEVVAFLDLEHGAKTKIKGRGYISHPLFLISEVVQILYETQKIGGDVYKFTLDFLEDQKEKKGHSKR